MCARVRGQRKRLFFKVNGKKSLLLLLIIILLLIMGTKKNKQLSGAQKRKKKKEKEEAIKEAIKEAVEELERLKLGPTALWTGLVLHHKDIFVSHVFRSKFLWTGE